MASSSSSSSSSSTTTSHFINTSSTESWSYDVFLSFRGKDTRKKFVDHLYSALQLQGIYTYKDDEKLFRGELIGLSLFKAIRESRIIVIVFSKNYADSSWCLDELEYIMKCKDVRGKTIFPIFYDVDPSDVRKQKGEFGEAFKKQERENITRAESWRKALVYAGNIAGWEPKQYADGHESKGIKEIVDIISDELFSLESNFSEDLVGMDSRLSHLISQLQIWSDGVRMVGIWGVGGGGKTTLASCAHMKISRYFEANCIVDKIREESGTHGLKKLQEKILSTILKTNVEVRSIEDGKQKIKSRLCRKRVLILLDDVDDLKQLEALAGSHNWFGKGSRVIITTRNEHLLRSHRVDEVSHISLLSPEEALQLFSRCAYRKKKPAEGYVTLSRRVVSYAAGLPLALEIIGSFLHGKERNEWLSTLDRLEDNPDTEILETLKISYDGLTRLEQELFLDIACFYRGESKDDAMVILNACGFHPVIGIRVLIQKALITITGGKFDMHDLVQEMGHYIVRGEHPNNPEKHSRIWKTTEINNMCSRNEIKANDKIEAIKYYGFSDRFPRFVSKMKKLRSLTVYPFIETTPKKPILLSNELRYLHWSSYPEYSFQESFQPVKLVYLKLYNTLQKELWKGYKYLPCLKELFLFEAPNLVTTPDFGGLPCLHQFTLKSCKSLESIHPSLGHHGRVVYVNVESNPKLRMFPTIVRMEKLERLHIWYCDVLREFPEIQTNMDSLINLSLGSVGIDVLPSSIGKYCTNLISLSLDSCHGLKRIEGNFHALKHLQELIFPSYNQLEKMPQDLFDDNCRLQKFKLGGGSQQLPFPRCLGFSRFPRFLTMLGLRWGKFKDGEIPSNIGELSNLQKLDLTGNHFTRLDFSLSHLTQLKLLNVTHCERLVQLPELPSSISVLLADHCKSLEAIGDIHSNCNCLSVVSLLNGSNVAGADKLLQSMLQGSDIEKYSMLLQVEGLEIPRRFTPPLRKGMRYTLELPENWCNDFCGFLMCGTMSEDYYYGYDKEITMTHKGVDSQSEFSSDNSVYIATWVLYVQFRSLRHTVWWDEKSNMISFSNKPNSALGVRLVPRKTQSVRMETTTNSIQINAAKNGFADKFQIKHDSKSALQCCFGLIDK